LPTQCHQNRIKDRLQGAKGVEKVLHLFRRAYVTYEQRVTNCLDFQLVGFWFAGGESPNLGGISGAAAAGGRARAAFGFA